MRKILLTTILAFGITLPSYSQNMLDVPDSPATPSAPTVSPEVKAISVQVTATARCFAVWYAVSRLDAITGVNMLALHRPEMDAIGKEFIHHSLVENAKIAEAAPLVAVFFIEKLKKANLTISPNDFANIFTGVASAKNTAFVESLESYSANPVISAEFSRLLHSEEAVCDDLVSKVIGHNPNELKTPIPEPDYSKF